MSGAGVSGPRRLAIFSTATWIVLWLAAYGLDTGPGPFRLDGFFLFGLVPPALVWGVWWVWCGFRPRSGARQ